MMMPGEQNDIKLINQFAKKGTDYAGIVQKIKELIP